MLENKTESGVRRWKGLTKAFMSVAVALPMMLSVQGCTDEEVATGLGVIAIGVGAVAIGVATDGQAPRCHGGYRSQCTDYRDRYGRYHRECREVYDSCARRYSLAGETAPGAQQLSGAMAERYGLSFAAADTLTQALIEARQGRAQGVYDLGLSREDMMNLSRFKSVSAEGVDRLSQNLNLSVEDTQTMLTRLTDDFKSQAADGQSPYWQACMDSGQWKTPENRSCQKSWWSGCSPETGASLCVPATH